MHLLHLANPGVQHVHQAALLERKEAALNGGDWPMIQKLYHPVLIQNYKQRKLAAYDVGFIDFLKTPDAEQLIQRHGQFKPLTIRIYAVEDQLPDPATPWKSRVHRLQFRVHGSDEYLYERLVQQIAEAVARGRDPSRLQVQWFASAARMPYEFYGSGTESSRQIFGKLVNIGDYKLTARVFEVPAEQRRAPVPPLLEPGTVRVIAEPIGASVAAKPAAAIVTSGRKKKQPAAAARTQPIQQQARAAPDACYAHISDVISDHLTTLTEARLHAAGMKAGGARGALNDPRLWSVAVQRAILDPKTYTGKADVMGLSPAQVANAGEAARAFWKQRGHNDLGAVVNAVTNSIGNELGAINSKAFFTKTATATIGDSIGDTESKEKRMAFNCGATKKIYRAAAIQAGIWERLKEASGYYGTANDDGGPDLGPTASLHVIRPFRYGCFAIKRDPAVLPAVYRSHAAEYLAPERLAPPAGRVSLAPGASAEDQMLQLRPMYSRRIGTEAGSDGGDAQGGDGSDGNGNSSGSENEALLFNRAFRRKHGYPHHSADSQSSDEDGQRVVVLAPKGSSKQAAAATTVTATLDIQKHRNFLGLVYRAYPSESAMSRVGLILVPSDAVFSTESLERVLKMVADGKKTINDFVDNYIIEGNYPGHMQSLFASKEPFKLVSRSRLHYHILPGGQLQPHKRWEEKLRERNVSTRLENLGAICAGYPESVRFASMPVLHDKFKD
jgi:hypothetical protein